MSHVQIYRAASRIITKRRAFVRLLRAKVRAGLRHSSRADWTARVSVLSLVVAVMWWSWLPAAGEQVVEEQVAGGQVAGYQNVDVPRAAQITATSAVTLTVTATATQSTGGAILAAPTPTATLNSIADFVDSAAAADDVISATASLSASASLTSGLAFTDATDDVILAAPIALEEEAIEGSLSTTDVAASDDVSSGDAADDTVGDTANVEREPTALEGNGVLAGNELVGDVIGNLDALFGGSAADAGPEGEAAAGPLPTGLPRVHIVSSGNVPGTSGRIPQFPTVTPTVGPPPPTPTPTPPPLPVVKGRLWSNFEPLPPSEADHFWVGRAFAPGTQTQLASPNYQFGSTAGGRYRAHHGVDIGNPHGTPVLAATDGTVVHAGPDAEALLGPYNNFYGNTVVIRLDRQLPVAGGALDVFLLYGHLSAVTVEVGQALSPGDVVGAVGMTGIAIGPHLHVEVRVGANTYEHNVNPYLWMEPLPGTGAVAVRVLSADGRTWPGAVVGLAQYGADGSATWGRQIITYQDIENIGPDPAWGENGAMDGVPPGVYRLATVINGERIVTDAVVNAGETTFVEMRTQQ